MFHGLSSGLTVGWPCVMVEHMDSTPDGSLEAIEREHIKSVLRLTSGNKRQAAVMLKISRGTLYRRLRDYGLDKLIRKPSDTLDDL